MTDYADEFLREILETTRVVAVVGISPNTVRPSYFVGRYLALNGTGEPALLGHTAPD